MKKNEELFCIKNLNQIDFFQWITSWSYGGSQNEKNLNLVTDWFLIQISAPA